MYYPVQYLTYPIEGATLVKPLNAYVISLNAAETHEGSFTLDRPGGVPGFLFLHFSTAARIHSVTGIRVEEPGSAILYRQDFPQWYTGVEASLTHDWMYLSGEDLEAAVEEYALPLNTVFYLRESSFIGPLLRQIQSERLRAEANWQAAVALLIHQFLLLVARHQLPENTHGVQTFRQKWVGPFTDVRIEMLSKLQRPWSVAELADIVCLSPPRFAVIYRDLFGVSPIEDLIQARLERARGLLLHSTLSVSQVAEQCGFDGVFHFSRLFHRRVGCPPSRYHQLMQGRLEGAQPSG